MGLDVYLYRYDDFDAVQKRREEVSGMEEKFYEEVAKEKGVSVDDLSDKDRDNAYSLLKYWRKGQPDLDEYGDVIAGCEEVSEDSLKHPDNICHLGYFRSSYNPSGLNHVLRDTVGDKDLYYIFESGFSERGEYYVKPDWSEALDRAHEVLEEFNAFVEKGGKYYTQTVNISPFTRLEELPGSEREAMQLFLEEMEKNGDRDGPWAESGYSNKFGTFSLNKPAEVLATIPGSKEGWAGKLMGKGPTKEPCVYVICKNEHEYKSYVESLEIVIETIEHVLSQSNPEQYILHWSG